MYRGGVGVKAKGGGSKKVGLNSGAMDDTIMILLAENSK